MDSYGDEGKIGIVGFPGVIAEGIVLIGRVDLVCWIY